MKGIPIPTVEEAERELELAQTLNPTPWVDHSRYVALAAKSIATKHPNLDADIAYIFGLLHDIGRREGWTDMRHAIDGHEYMNSLGYEAVAKICLTHSFPMKDDRRAETNPGEWDCSAEQLEYVNDYMSKVIYDDYDRLLQLCDALALTTGFCILEKRFVDIVLRYGFNDSTVPRWRAFIELKDYFESTINCSIYSLLDGVVESTFDFEEKIEA